MQDANVRNNPDTFEFSLETERKNFLEAAGLFLEFEVIFRPHAERAAQNGKDGIFITHDEYECIVANYRLAHNGVTAAYNNIMMAMRQVKLQNRILEAMLQDEILLRTMKKEPAHEPV